MVIKLCGEDIVIKLMVGGMDKASAGELVDEETGRERDSYLQAITISSSMAAKCF